MSVRQIHDFTVNGECSKCGNCCGDLLPLKPDEIRKLMKYVKTHGIKEQRHNALVGADLTCPFRDEVKRICTVYPARPWICRQFMCNHTQEDIMKIKAESVIGAQIISMRYTFFGDDECLAYLNELIAAYRRIR